MSRLDREACETPRPRSSRPVPTFRGVAQSSCLVSFSPRGIMGTAIPSLELEGQNSGSKVDLLAQGPASPATAPATGATLLLILVHTHPLVLCWITSPQTCVVVGWGLGVGSILHPASTHTHLSGCSASALPSSPSSSSFSSCRLELT